MLTNDRLNDDVLAAFIDGKLPASERARVMTVLASDREQYSAFLEAAQIADTLRADAALRGEDAAVRGIDARRRTFATRRSIVLAMPALIAAGIAAVVWLPRKNAATDAIDLIQSTPLLATRSAGSQPAGWDATGWSVSRGESAALANQAAALRVGARVAQLEFAAATHDSDATRRIMPALATLIAAFDGAGPASAQLQQAAPMTQSERAIMARQLRALSGAPVAFDVGAWLLSARFAAATNREAFFLADGNARRELRQVTAQLERDPQTQRWAELRAHLKTLDRSRALDVGAIRLQVDSAIAAFPN